MAWVREVSPSEAEETQGQRELFESPGVSRNQFFKVLQAFGRKGSDAGGRHISGMWRRAQHRQAVSRRALLVLVLSPQSNGAEISGEVTSSFLLLTI